MCVYVCHEISLTHCGRIVGHTAFDLGLFERSIPLGQIGSVAVSRDLWPVLSICEKKFGIKITLMNTWTCIREVGLGIPTTPNSSPNLPLLPIWGSKKTVKIFQNQCIFIHFTMISLHPQLTQIHSYSTGCGLVLFIQVWLVRPRTYHWSVHSLCCKKNTTD